MESAESGFKEFRSSFNQFIWHTRKGERPAWQWLFIRFARTLILAVRGFVRHQDTLRASALTFFSLLSVVPVAAMAFGIAKGFGFEKRLQEELLDNFAAQQEVVEQIIGFAQNLLDNTKGGMVAGVGVILLFWTVIRVLGNIENSFNHIWGVRSRTMMRKLSDYLTIMLICPILMIMSGSVTVFITSQVSAISNRYEVVQMIGPAIYSSLKLIPYMLIWLLFTLVYMIMPNTRVKMISAFFAGILAGTAFQIVQGAYIHFQIFVAKYNAIYGSFAALPLFLMWLQISWFIVLIGAEFSYAFQNSEYVAHTEGGREMSISQTNLLALALCHHVVRLFSENRPAQNKKEIADALSISPILVGHLAKLLVQGKILVWVEGNGNKEKALQPARDIGFLKVGTVLTALADVGKSKQPIPQLSEEGVFFKLFSSLRSELDRSDNNRLIKDI
jgi:membrane protein